MFGRHEFMKFLVPNTNVNIADAYAPNCIGCN